MHVTQVVAVLDCRDQRVRVLQIAEQRIARAFDSFCRTRMLLVPRFKAFAVNLYDVAFDVLGNKFARRARCERYGDPTGPRATAVNS